MKQAIQLEIQWSEPCTAQPSPYYSLEMRTASALSRLMHSIVFSAKAVLCVVFAIVCVAFAFGLMFFAAIIGG